jgi:septal ring factor EnvC (AmiA/AmiB activator)
MRQRSVNIIFCFLVCLLGCICSVSAQKTKSQLQREKQQNIEKIKETEKILEETSQQKKTSLGELNALNERVQQQETLISSITGEIHLLDNDISENNQIIFALQTDLKKLKQEYATMLFAAQKGSGKADKLMFLFSASSFDQLMMRLKYMEQYGQARKAQAEAISRIEVILGDQVQQIEVIKAQKNNLLHDEVTENDNLSNLKQKQKATVKSLEKEEKRLHRDLDETEKAVAILDKRINEIIKEEIERVAREAREREAKSKSGNASAPVVVPNLALSSSFEENKSKFPWPAQGFISQKFGRQNHPVLPNIIIDNEGINIQSRLNEQVVAIFEGDVKKVAITPGIGITVLISHGNYYTVYSGLKDVQVKSGDKVKINQELGKLVTNAQGYSELRFRIYKNIEPLNPEEWLRK